MSNKIINVTNNSFEKEVEKSDLPVLVDFWATWCKPCKMIAPVIEALAEELDGKVKFAKIDVDDNPEIAEKYEVMGIPVLLLFKEGKLVDKIVGAVPKNNITKILNKYLTLKEKKEKKVNIKNISSDEVTYTNAGTISISNSESGITLYKHQEEAIDSLNKKILKDNKSTFSGLLVLPTGGGKTLTSAYWIAKNLLDKNKKVLWIAHRHELLNQAKETFHKALSFKDIFRNIDSFNYRVISSVHDKPVNIKSTDDLIISSKDSLNTGIEYVFNNWIKNQNEEIFLVIDEAHHAIAKTYRKIIDNLSQKTKNFKMLGLTATPFRTAENEAGFLGKIFSDNIVYKVDLRTLISRGILSEPIFEEIDTRFNMSGILNEKDLDKIKYFDIDSIGRDTARKIAENKERNMAIVNQYINNKNKYKQTIIFALNQDNAIALNALFKEKNIRSEYVISSIKDQATGVTISSKENSDKIERFRKGLIDVLINVNILTEGTDLPLVQSIFLARPTISSTLMTQMIGRGLRGEKAGGTKSAYIVSFIDNWQDKVVWVNPEKVLIEENIDFNNKDIDSIQKIIRLISINKIEEFAILTNKIIDNETKKGLENLPFTKRIPLGIYYLSFLKEGENNIQIEENKEILIYDNVKQSYQDFVNYLPELFNKRKLFEKDYFTKIELNNLVTEIEDNFFFGCEKYPSYRKEDIEDILNYYLQNEVLPKYIELSIREKLDIDKIALNIFDLDMKPSKKRLYTEELWNSSELEWKAFFGYDKRNFLNDLDLSIRKLENPDLFKTTTIIPEDTKELRKLENLSMSEIKEIKPEYWKWLSDSVYSKYKNKNGEYVSASKNYKSKNKLDFQIDHIKPLSKGGLTVLDNLQLLTKSENSLKGVN